MASRWFFFKQENSDDEVDKITVRKYYEILSNEKIITTYKYKN